MSTVKRLQCLEKLGEGTYGVVYKAREIATGQIVAFKRMIISGEDEGIPATAIREVCLLKRLKHSNIVRLYDVLLDPPKMTLIFEYCEYDLKKFIERNRNMVQQEVRQILKQVLMGLRYMHRLSVVHRDLKPENIFLNINPVAQEANSSAIITTSAEVASQGSDKRTANHCHRNSCGNVAGNTIPDNDGDVLVFDDDIWGGGSGGGVQLSVKLGDYGLARVENIPVKKYSHDVVSLWYRSPDVMLGSALYGFAVDMWSVGCIFAEMVTGKPLLTGHTDVDQIVKIFQLLGTPTPATWPSMMTYPKSAQMLEAAYELVQDKNANSGFHRQQPTRNMYMAGVEQRTTHTQLDSTHCAGENGTMKMPVVLSNESPTKGSNTLNSAGFGGPTAVTVTEETHKKMYNFQPELCFNSTFMEYVENSRFREIAGDDGVDLLEKLIRYEPSHRIKAHEALCHPFLSKVALAVQRPVDVMTTLLRQSLENHGLLETCGI